MWSLRCLNRVPICTTTSTAVLTPLLHRAVATSAAPSCLHHIHSRTFCRTAHLHSNNVTDSHSHPAVSAAAQTTKSQAKPAKSSKKNATAASSATSASAVDSRQSYMQLRQQELVEAGLCSSTGHFLYPNTHHPSLTISTFLSTYSHLQSGESSTDVVELCGRIHSKRDASNQLIFYDLVGSDAQGTTTTKVNEQSDATTQSDEVLMRTLTQYSPKVQVMATATAHGNEPTTTNTQSSTSSDSTAATSSSPSSIDAASAKSLLRPAFQRAHRVLRRGDFIHIRGRPQKTKTGELSIVPYEVKLLAPCWREIPVKLNEPNSRYRHRYLDMLINRRVLLPFHLRSLLLSTLRSFLTRRNFIEVETPILWTTHGGANAKPFVTHSHAFGDEMPLYLRIAPELQLKELIIGGMERVFEVSKVFRNEGIDATHNPEFTTVELYVAYQTYEDMMKMTEDMLKEISERCNHSTLLTIQNRFKLDETVTIDFAQPFKRLDVMNGLKEALGSQEELPDPNSPSSIPFYLSACEKIGLHIPQPHTLPKLLDKLVGHYLEPQCLHPTFLVHHPECMSPLARRHPTRKGLTERFELIINGREYANAYSELNDPVDQQQRMMLQAQAAKEGDEEAQPLDQHFCEALEYGLPPTAGWGLGIDRLVMLLSGTSHIRDVLLFPVMKPLLPQQAQGQSSNVSTTTTQ